MRRLIVFCLSIMCLLPSCSRLFHNGNIESGDFSVNLYSTLREEMPDENFVVSPYSLSSALLLCASGALGNTAQEIYACVGGESRLPVELSSNDENVIVHTANSIWYDESISMKSAYLRNSWKDFGANVEALDFLSGTAAARINGWISEQTEGLIKDMLQEPLSPSTLLVNALYFKAPWRNCFEKEEGLRPFYGMTPADCRYFTGEEEFGYLETSSYKAVSIPYSYGSYSFIVVMPKPGKFDKAIKNLENRDEFFAQISDYSNNRMVSLAIPEFSMESTLPLVPVLMSMGIRTAFGSRADFSRMTGEENFAIADVLQKAKVSVDAEGTEAAAATIIMVGMTALREPKERVEFVADHPFIYMICDNRTKTVLFIGQKVN